MFNNANITKFKEGSWLYVDAEEMEKCPMLSG
jgi:hypothetical protein